MPGLVATARPRLPSGRGRLSTASFRRPARPSRPSRRLEVWRAVREASAQGTTILLTTQYLDEAEQLADRIAILHEGRIIADGTLAELKSLIPPATVEYVEKQPTLEEVFLAIIGDTPAADASAASTDKESS